MRDWKATAIRLKNREERAEERMNTLLTAIAGSFGTYAGAGLMGYLHGRRGGIPTVGGVPIDGLLGSVFSLLGAGAVYYGYTLVGALVGGFGNGAGAKWFSDYMADWGEERRDKAGEKLNRVYTTEEALKEKVQVRQPILAGERADNVADNVVHINARRRDRLMAEAA